MMITMSRNELKKESKLYRDNYINEIKMCLKFNYGADNETIDFLIARLKNMMNKDSNYVFHYNSEYWAKYMAEARGLIKVGN